MRTRQRMLKSAAELGDCNEELEQAEKCMLPECRECAGRRLPPRVAEGGNALPSVLALFLRGFTTALFF